MFYLFIVLNGYSPHYEGLNLIYFSDATVEQTLSDEKYLKYEIKKITDDDLTDAPIIKTMLDVALSQEFPLHSTGFTEIVGFRPYRIMSIGEDIYVTNYMSHEDMKEYGKWISGNLQQGFFEYKGKIFTLGAWIA